MANVLVIGGGAAGLLAGIAAAQSGAKTIILEKMRRPGKKYLLPARGAAILPITAICRKLLKTYPATAAF